MIIKKPKQILEWLEKRDLLEKFRNNYESQHKVCSQCYRLLRNNDLERLKEQSIIAGFNWGETPEGWDFWHNANKEFLKWYYKDLFFSKALLEKINTMHSGEAIVVSFNVSLMCLLNEDIHKCNGCFFETNYCDHIACLSTERSDNTNVTFELINNTISDSDED